MNINDIKLDLFIVYNIIKFYKIRKIFINKHKILM